MTTWHCGLRYQINIGIISHCWQVHLQIFTMKLLFLQALVQCLHILLISHGKSIGKQKSRPIFKADIRVFNPSLRLLTSMENPMLRWTTSKTSIFTSLLFIQVQPINLSIVSVSMMPVSITTITQETIQLISYIEYYTLTRKSESVRYSQHLNCLFKVRLKLKIMSIFTELWMILQLLRASTIFP
jgi:hypothetical protein